MINNEKFRKIRIIIGKKLIGAALVLLGLTIILAFIIRPNIIKVCEYNSRSVTISLIDDAINARLDELENADYHSLVSVRYDEHGKVSSIESNTTLINRIKTDMLSEINDRLKNGSNDDVKLSAGTLCGISAFHGFGPEVSMRIEPKGYADAVFISEFTDAGVNQTRHRIIMRTTVNVTAFIPFYAVECKVSGDFLVAETVIVGNIPESYTHVISGNEDVIDGIFDFGAEPIE